MNIAIQKVIAAGIEVLDTQHQRKATSDNKRPGALADVYGSTWLTSRHGSVVLLWGEPGDPVVPSLPSACETVSRTFLLCLRARTGVRWDAGRGITVADAALRVWGPGATRNELEKTRRKLDGAVKAGLALRLSARGCLTPRDMRGCAR